MLFGLFRLCVLFTYVLYAAVGVRLFMLFVVINVDLGFAVNLRWLLGVDYLCVGVVLWVFEFMDALLVLIWFMLNNYLVGVCGALGCWVFDLGSRGAWIACSIVYFSSSGCFAVSWVLEVRLGCIVCLSGMFCRFATLQFCLVNYFVLVWVRFRCLILVDLTGFWYCVGGVPWGCDAALFWVLLGGWAVYIYCIFGWLWLYLDLFVFVVVGCYLVCWLGRV